MIVKTLGSIVILLIIIVIVSILWKKILKCCMRCRNGCCKKRSPIYRGQRRQRSPMDIQLEVIHNNMDQNDEENGVDNQNE